MGRKESVLYVIFRASFTIICIWLAVYIIFGIQLKSPYASLYEGFQEKSSPFFSEAYVINMDMYPDRFKRVEANAKDAGFTIKRWRGVQIKEEDVRSLPEKGIGTLIFTSRAGGARNLGAIGCFLAHRGLLEHIAANYTGVGTFICEDDVVIPSDFFSKLEAVSSEIPEDWDIIYMNKYMLDTTTVSTGVLKLKPSITANTNMGTWAFIVKNSSIGGKILPLLKQMIDEIDLQISKNADILNLYLIDPPITYLHSAANESIIEKIDKGTN